MKHSDEYLRQQTERLMIIIKENPGEKSPEENFEMVQGVLRQIFTNGELNGKLNAFDDIKSRLEKMVELDVKRSDMYDEWWDPNRNTKKEENQL